MSELIPPMSQPVPTHDAGRLCRCVVNHNPNPTHIQRHHIWPLGEGGPDTEANTVWLCANAHENVHVLLREYKRYEGEPPWEVRKRFSRYIRTLAAKGWEAIVRSASTAT